MFKNSFEKEKGSYKYKPSYCLWFIGFKMFDDEIAIREFKLSDITNEITLIDDSGIIIVEFAKFKKCGYNKNSWYNLFLTNDLSELRGEPLMAELVNSIKDLNEDDEFVFKIDERERAEREYNARMEGATEMGLEKGLRQGIQQGLEQGMQKGERNKAIEVAKKMKQKGISIEDIIDMTGLSKEEIESL